MAHDADWEVDFAIRFQQLASAVTALPTLVILSAVAWGADNVAIPAEGFSPTSIGTCTPAF